MILVQLKYAITVAGQNSLNDVAKVFFISQPTLSSAIRSLEKKIGIDIFIQSKNGITFSSIDCHKEDVESYINEKINVIDIGRLGR